MGDAAAARPWAGRTVACIASGPSLAREDCDAVRDAGLPAIVINTSFRLAPWADVLYAMDSKWWALHIAEVRAVFSGRLMSSSQGAIKHGAKHIGNEPWFFIGGNSGAGAVSIAQHFGASAVLLLGYDCQFAQGRTHWHSDHPQGLSNALSIKRWPAQFARVEKWASKRGLAVVNCSRETALTCFPRKALHAALAD